MRYIQVNNNIWVEIDESTMRSTVFDMSLIPSEIQALQDRLSEIPADPTDEEMLAWAKINFPRMDYSAEKGDLLDKISKLQDKLNANG